LAIKKIVLDLIGSIIHILGASKPSILEKTPAKPQPPPKGMFVFVNLP